MYNTSLWFLNSIINIWSSISMSWVKHHQAADHKPNELCWELTSWLKPTQNSVREWFFIVENWYCWNRQTIRFTIMKYISNGLSPRKNMFCISTRIQTYSVTADHHHRSCQATQVAMIFINHVHYKIYLSMLTIPHHSLPFIKIMLINLIGMQLAMANECL